MKKALLILAAVVFIAPVSILAFMPLEDEELETVRGQDSLDYAFGGVGFGTVDMRWTDADGSSYTAFGASGTGYLQASGVSLTQSGNDFTCFTTSAPLTLEAGGDGGSNTYVILEYPQITDWQMSFPSLILGGSSITTTRDMGAIYLDNISTGSSNTMQVRLDANASGYGVGAGMRISLATTSGTFAIGDPDGFDATYLNAAYLNIDGMQISNNAGGRASYEVDIDAGSDGTYSKIKFTGGPLNDFSVRNARVALGSTVGAAGGTLFTFDLGNMDQGAPWTTVMEGHHDGTTGMQLTGGFNISDGYLAVGDTDGFTETFTGTYTTAGYITWSGGIVANSIDPVAYSGSGMFNFLSTDVDVGLKSGVVYWTFNDDDVKWGELMFKYIKMGAGVDSGPSIYEWYVRHLSGSLFLAFTGIANAPTTYYKGLSMYLSTQVTDQELVMGDNDGFGTTYTTMGYLGLIQWKISNTANTGPLTDTFTLDGGTSATGQSCMRLTMSTVTGRVAFTPSVDKTPGGTSDGTMCQVAITGSMGGTMKIYSH